MSLDAITSHLLNWFSKAGRDLPWRRTYTPYQVWISEIMLQQTQMERGVAYFTRWLTRFPDVQTLAAASEDDVLKYWEGLGYYSRARNLHRAARIVRDQHAGHLPSDPKLLESLPGIGAYTARAIASIAFKRDVCVIDANVERVMARLFAIKSPVKSRQTRQEIEAHCSRLLPTGQARAFNQAVMEFGALVCTPKNPACATCPLSSWCQARLAGVQESLPVTAPKQSPIFITMVTGVLVHNGRILTQKRQPDDVWGNLWEFPGGVLEAGETPEQAVVREYLEETNLRVRPVASIADFRHSYTRYRVRLYACFVELESNPADIVLRAAKEYRFATWSEIHTLAFPAGHRKLIEHLDADTRFQARIAP